MLAKDLRAWYLQLKFKNRTVRDNNGIYTDIVVMVAEDVNSAINVLKEKLKNQYEVIDTPWVTDESGNLIRISGDVLATYGHGKAAKAFISDPYRSDVCNQMLTNYTDNPISRSMQIFNYDGEELFIQNDITNPIKDSTPKDPPKDPTIIIPVDNVDDLEAGIGFVKDDTPGKEQGYIVVSRRILNDDGTVTIEQAAIFADGTYKVRKSDDKGLTWTAWKLTSVFTEQSPEDELQYVRVNQKWVALKYDDVPTLGSTNLVNSGKIKEYVEQKVVKVYRYCGSKTAEELQSMTEGNVVGDVYNCTTDGTIIIGDNSIKVRSGDNVVWSPDNMWDNLVGFVDVDAIKTYVDDRIKEVANKTTLIKANLLVGWNNVKLGSKIEGGWAFTSSPYCYTEDGSTCEFHVRNLENYIVDNESAFEIRVPVNCTVTCTISPIANL